MKSQQEFNDAMEIIKKRGIIRTGAFNIESSVVYQYNFNTDLFNIMDKSKLLVLFNKLYVNSYGENYTIYDILKAIPIVNLSSIENYYKYRDIKDKEFSVDDLTKRTNQYLAENEDRKKEFYVISWALQSQIQNLINQNVFSDGRKLYQYVNGKFNWLNPNNMMSLFKDKGKLEHISTSKIKLNYPYYVRNLVNVGSLISELNEYEQFKNILITCNDDYEKIKTLIDGFD